MNDTELDSWTAAPLGEDDLNAHYQAAVTYADELRKIGRSHRNLGFIVGAAGAVVAVGSLLTVAAMMPLKQTVVRWIAVDQSVGFVGPPITPADALTIINDKARKSLVKQLVTSCESFNAATLDLTDHACNIMLSPEQQVAYRQRTGKANLTAPINVLGPKGLARVEDAMRFWDEPPARPGTYGYTVRFLRTVMLPGGRPIQKQWIAKVYFSLHPEAAMTPADALINPAGVYAFGYSAHAEDDAQ